MFFSDIHSHLLYGTDDGAKTREEMYELVDASYENGFRLICVTPHFAPSFFDDNREAASRAYKELTEYCAEKYKDLKLFMGNELFYTHDSISWMKQRLSIPMGDTRYVLVEFDVAERENMIAEAVDRLLNIGYIPIIAHAERYKKLTVGRLSVLKESGVLVQMNSEAFLRRRFDFGYKRRVANLLKSDMVDFISTDCHNLQKRPPEIKAAYEYILEKYGEKRANALCRENACKLLCHECLGKEDA